jgi:hypothetical protein
MDFNLKWLLDLMEQATKTSRASFLVPNPHPFLHSNLLRWEFENANVGRLIGFAISIETPPVDCQFGNAANMFSNFLTIIASLDFC